MGKAMTKKFLAIEQDKNRNNKSVLKPFGDQQNNETKSTEPNSIFSGMINVSNGPKLQLIDITKIDKRPVNKYDDIGLDTFNASLRHVGIIHPIVLRDRENGRYTIISGHRRWTAYTEIVKEIEEELTQANDKEKEELLKELEKFKKIPATVYVVVANDSDLLGKDPKYITSAQEEEMYQAANMENRQLSKKSLFENIDYFYKLFTTDKKFYSKELARRNINAKRKATKLDIPTTIAKVVTVDLKFPVSRESVRRYIEVIELTSKYKTYGKIANERLEKGEGIRTIWEDFKRVEEIYENVDGENFDDKARAITRIEKGKESVEEVYNEYFNIKKPKVETESKTRSFKKDEILEILYKAKNEKSSIDDIIKHIINMN